MSNQIVINHPALTTDKDLLKAGILHVSDCGKWTIRRQQYGTSPKRDGFAVYREGGIDAPYMCCATQKGVIDFPGQRGFERALRAVSYTHLTLPTKA